MLFWTTWEKAEARCRTGTSTSNLGSPFPFTSQLLPVLPIEMEWPYGNSILTNSSNRRGKGCFRSSYHLFFAFIPDFTSVTSDDSATDSLPAPYTNVAPQGWILRDLPGFPAPKPSTESQHNPKEPNPNLRSSEEMSGVGSLRLSSQCLRSNFPWEMSFP